MPGSATSLGVSNPSYAFARWMPHRRGCIGTPQKRRIFLTNDHNAAVLDRVKTSASLVAPFCLANFLMLTTTTQMIVRESILIALAPLLDPEHAILSLGSRDSANSPFAKMDQQQSQPSALLCRHDQDDGR
jgi:hypothetical protein